MEESNNWIFTEKQLSHSPSRQHLGITMEMSYRKQDGTFIHDIGKVLRLPVLPVITAIVYMHRFYTVRSFDEVLRYELCLAALFLAAKVHGHHLQLEQVIKAGNFSSGFPHLDVKSEIYLTKMKGVLFHEEILISVLGFCLDVMHPHPFVVLVCKAIKASEELSEVAYILATQSIINTTMSLKFSPRTVACICIHAACKIFSYKIQACTENPNWFSYVDSSLTLELLESLTMNFIGELGKGFGFTMPQSENVADSRCEPGSSNKRVLVRIPRRFITVSGDKPEIPRICPAVIQKSSKPPKMVRLASKPSRT